MINKLMLKLLLIFVFGILNKQTCAWSDILHEEKNMPAMQSLDTQKIDFGFVLLEDEFQSEINELATIAASRLQLHSLQSNVQVNNIKVRIPHLSLGQYGCLGIELNQLKCIVDDIATRYCVFQEPIKNSLTVTDKNIFWDVTNIKDQINPILVQLYHDFRTQYFEKIYTKHPVAQALYQKLVHKNNSAESKFIDQFYQNWGTPEEDRIQPHFTLVYNCDVGHKNAEYILQDIALPKLPEGKISFIKLGLVEIDFYGNPLNLLLEIPLMKRI